MPIKSNRKEQKESVRPRDKKPSIELIHPETGLKFADFYPTSSKENIVCQEGGRWNLVYNVSGVCGMKINVKVKAYEAKKKIQKCQTKGVSNRQRICAENERIYVFCFGKLNEFKEVIGYTDHHGAFKRKLPPKGWIKMIDKGSNIPFHVLFKGTYKVKVDGGKEEEKEAYMIPLPNKTSAWISEDMIGKFASITSSADCEPLIFSFYDSTKKATNKRVRKSKGRKEGDNQPPYKKTKLKADPVQQEVYSVPTISYAVSQGEGLGEEQDKQQQSQEQCPYFYNQEQGLGQAQGQVQGQVWAQQQQQQFQEQWAYYYNQEQGPGQIQWQVQGQPLAQQQQQQQFQEQWAYYYNQEQGLGQVQGQEQPLEQQQQQQQISSPYMDDYPQDIQDEFSPGDFGQEF